MRVRVLGALSFILVFLLAAQPAFAGEFYILSVGSASTVPSKVYPGDVVTMNFTISNVSGIGAAASNVSVSLGLNENDFEPIKALEKFDSIGSKSSKAISLRFRANENVLPGTYRIPVIMEYDNGRSHLVQSEEVNFSVQSCSQLKIDRINLSYPKPHIGDTLRISASIKNACTTSARNVSVELRPVTNSTIAPFIVTSGTVQKIGDLLPNSARDADFEVTVGDKVDAKAYVFALDGNCDECSKTFTNQFSFQVLGKPELVFSNIEYSVDNASKGSEKVVLQGSTFTLSIQLDNIGDEKAKAVEVSVNFGDAVKGTSKSFLGNINSDDSGAAVFTLGAAFDAKPGEHPGKITVSYIDELGARQEFMQDYSVYISSQPPVSPVVYLVILVLLALVLGIAYLIIKFVFRQLAIRKSQQSR